MSTKQPAEIEHSTNEYAEIFARLAVDEPTDAVDDEALGEAELDPEIATVNDEAGDAAPESDSEISDPPSDAEATETESEISNITDESEVTTLQSEIDDVEVTASLTELKPAIEAILFVADEPVPFNQLCKILGDVNSADAQAAIVELISDYEARGSGLELREIAGGWRISTRAQHHEFIRKYLKSKPSARLSLPALETLAVIAYKQPVTVPEVLEIRGVSSSSAIKTLLEKRLIVTKGRKETVGRPMMYGTSKEFLIQFGLRDLNELPSIEDFEELAA
jgi:segregation and condensation protein B